MNTIFNIACFRRFAVSCVLFALMGPVLWAGGKQENIPADGNEVWEHDYDVTEKKKGLYNFIVYAKDRAGNESISGPFNVKVNPNAGLPVARVVYPENNAIVRGNINVLGVASGRYGVSRVLARIDDNDYIEVSGTEYWNQLIDFSYILDGKHSLYVQAIDSKDVAGPVQRLNFTLDTSPPEIELTSHSIGDIITGTTTIKGQAVDANGIKILEYSEDGETFTSLPGKKKGNTTQDFSLSINTKKVEDGPLVFYVRAVDSTGVAIVNPYLFFASNNGPDLEVYTPAPNEDVYGSFFLSGRAYNEVGLSKLYYEWGKIKEDIEMRPGDPFWSVPLEMIKGSAPTIKVVAVDKAGNSVSITRKLEDRRKVKVPVLVIDYPTEDVLALMQKGISANTAIYGHIAPGADPRSIMVDGFGEVEALSSFRIDPRMIPHGSKVQTLKITPVDVNSINGVPRSLKYLKLNPLIQDESEIEISAPAKNSWASGSSFSLQGKIAGSNMQLEYRLNPQDDWQPVRLDLQGGFSADISMAGRLQGPVHLELRTVQYGEEHYPQYHPFYWAASEPEVQIISPTGEYALVFGGKTVMGVIEHGVPIYNVAYSLDQRNYTDIPFSSRYGKAWFNYFCNFTNLGFLGGKLVFRVTDFSGARFEVIPEYTIDTDPPIPVIIVNTPIDNEVITDAFDISGLAYYDVDIQAVFWRVLGPKMESISPGAAGEEARRAASVYRANPDVPFKELLTDQNFRIPVDFSMIIDGEYTVEIYAADIYGVCSETISRTIRVSSAPPETIVSAPVITRYNQKAIMIKGFSSDANGVENVSVSMDNANTFQDVVLTPSGNWELALNTAAYKDGVYSALLRTEDKYGIIAFTNTMINIDNTPPEVFLTSPLSGDHVGNNMKLMGRVSDNITLKSLTLQIISGTNPNFQRSFDLRPDFIISDTVSLAGYPLGDYIIRIVAKDLADNETLVSRKIVFDPNDTAAEIAIYNPLPGEIHSGPVYVAGIVSGAFHPNEVTLLMDGRELDFVSVDRFGIFRYEIPEEKLSGEGAYKLSAYYNSETNARIVSPEYTLYYATHGPILQVESHQDGDVITARPWLTGRAWVSVPEPEEPLTRTQKATQKTELKVDRVMVSHDNGRTFKSASGTDKWKFRMETSELPRGPHPVLVRAEFANGEEAVRRLMVYVDTTLPQVETLSPPEDSVHRDNIHIFGTAEDNYELNYVEMALRKGDKFFYSVPGAIKGMYFDVKALGATYFDVGLGISLFDDNVRLQGQFGIAPADGITNQMVGGGRYVGYVYGIKLLANIFHLPFAWMFGLDWGFYSMNIAIGANFSYFMMDDWREPLFMGAVLAQWDIANIDFKFFKPNWKYFRNYALYLQPELWFASTDAQKTQDVYGNEIEVKKIIFRMTIGIRINWF
jgi:hypothetical protein